MANTLDTVTTVAQGNLPILEAQMPLCASSNTKFEGFENIFGNLGNAVNIRLPYRTNSNPGLVIAPGAFDDIEQEFAQLVVGADNTTKSNANYVVTDEERLFNKLDGNDIEIMNLGKSNVSTLATTIESNVSEGILPATYRFFGSWSVGVVDTPVDPINTYGQLAAAVTQHQNYGWSGMQFKGYVPDYIVNQVIATGFTEFVLDRNERGFKTWRLGTFDRTEWYQSNLLPIHTSGTVGIAQDTLTITAIDPTGTSVTFASSGVDGNTILTNDLIQFQAEDLRVLGYQSRKPGLDKVSCRVTADSTVAAASITVTVEPALLTAVQSPKKQYISRAFALATDEASVAPSHRAGMLVADNAFYVAIPRLGDTKPYDSYTATSPKTGISMRVYYGHIFAQAQKAMVWDAIWGKLGIPQYCMRLLFPLNS